jgi:hypothetical protein
MRNFLTVVCLFYLFSFFSPSVVYGSAWERCKGCHNGNTAPDEKSMKQKYPTVKKFIEAAKKSDDPFMIGFKDDEKLLKKAAKEIGLQ